MHLSTTLLLLLPVLLVQLAESSRRVGKGCTKCTPSQVTFAKASGQYGIDTSGTFGTDPSTGCLTLAASCTADLNYWAYMQFNINQGGPADSTNDGRTITANLNCVDGSWVYTSGGISRVVTQVSCDQAPDAWISQ